MHTKDLPSGLSSTFLASHGQILLCLKQMFQVKEQRRTDLQGGWCMWVWGNSPPLSTQTDACRPGPGTGTPAPWLEPGGELKVTEARSEQQDYRRWVRASGVAGLQPVSRVEAPHSQQSV